MIFAFIAAITNAIENIIDRLLLRGKDISYKQYIAVSITVIFLLSLISWPFLGNVDNSFFTSPYIFLFLGVIVLAFFYNILFFYSMGQEELCDVEPFVLLNKPLTVIMAIIIFPSERNIWPIIFTLIAVVALMYSRIDKRHLSLKFKKTTWYLIIFGILISIESQLVKILLTVSSPVALYSMRTGFLALLFWFLLRPNMKKLSRKNVRNISINGTITYIQFIARFYAIAYLGIVQSTLILLLAPVISLTYSRVFMRENLTKKKAMADIIILACVIATLILR